MDGGRASDTTREQQTKNRNQIEMKTAETNVTIKAPSIETATFRIVGTAPYVQLRFSQKAINAMTEKMKLGSQANKKKAKDARDFDEDFHQAMHISTDGWPGIPASSFRNACISACRLVGFKMTLAKLSVFVDADGFDRVDAVPLVKIQGEPEPLIMHARNATGVCDIRVRAKFFPWSADVRVSYDTDQFSVQDIANLLLRAGQQVGIGEGRPDSKMSCGMGWGTFTLEQ